MRSNSELIDYMCNLGVLKTPEIIHAFEKIDRKYFIPSYLSDDVYGDYPLPIGANQTISQPSTVAFMLELLGANMGDMVLDIGSGSGWTTALLCEIVGQEGSVVALERIEKLLKLGEKNLKRFGFENLSMQKAEKKLGKVGEIFDRILVSASAENIPKELFKQLKTKGILVIPIKNSIYKFKRLKNNGVQKESFYGFEFVPLIH